MKLLIVDDESVARAAMRRVCERFNDIHCICEADSGASAIASIERNHPDAVLLNVSLSDMSGFEVLRRTQGQNEHRAIIVASHSEHAVKAFSMGAIDYLIKPVGSEELLRAIERVRHRKQVSNGDYGAVKGENGVGAEEVAVVESPLLPQRIVGEREHRLYLLDPHRVDYIEADGNYVQIRSSGALYISRGSIKNLCTELSKFGFVRIGRSLLINVRAVEYAERLGRGVFAFTLTCGSRLVSSASYGNNVLSAMRIGKYSKDK